MSINLNKKLIIVISGILILISIVITGVYLLNPPKVGFKGLSQNEIEILKPYIEDKKYGFKRGIKYIELEKNINIYSDLDMLISKENDKIDVDSLEPINGDVYGILPISIQKSIAIDNKIYSIPYELDHIELTFNSYIKGDKENTFDSFNHYESQLLNLADLNNFTPLVVAGSDNYNLGYFISFLLLSLTSSQEYMKIINMINNLESIDNIMQNTDINIVVDKIKEWETAGILHNEWLNYTFKDLLFSMEHDLTSSVIIKLSQHREIPLDTIRKFKSSPVPSNNKGIILKYPAIYIFKDSRYKKQGITILKNILSNNGQKGITFKTKLAPTSTSSETYDMQSAEVRYWSAISKSIHTPIENRLFIEKFREYLIVN